MRSRKPLFAAIGIFFSLALVEGVLHLVVERDGHVRKILGRSSKYLVPFDVPAEMPGIVAAPGAYRRYDAQLGWTINERGAEPPLYFSDEGGARVTQAEHEQGKPRPQGARIMTIGDSFTHGDEVKAEDAWPDLLAGELGEPVLNLGVGGYGVDQAIWRWEASRATPRIVLLGLITGDFERSMSPIYNFNIGGLKSKPMFVFTGDRAEVANRPALHGQALRAEFQRGTTSPLLTLDHDYDPRLFERSAFDWLYLYRIPRSIGVWKARRHPPAYLAPGPRFDYSMQVLERAQTLARQREVRLVIVLLANANNFVDAARTGGDPFTHLRSELARRGYEVIDTTGLLTGMYEKAPDSVINRGQVHYTPEANRAVADVVAEWLRARP